jgi:ATP-dependent DNA helicase PIF1
MTDIILTKEQNKALEILLTTNDNVFITGGAGTGKTFLINRFVEELNKSKPNHTCYKVASTGVSALLAGGITIHSFFGIGAPNTIQELLFNFRRFSATNPIIKDKIRSTDVLIIDEISMVNDYILNGIEQICRTENGSTEPWGGIRIICVGDFAQLPPINQFLPWINKKIEPNQIRWAFNSTAWSISNFRSIILKDIVRTSDVLFSSVLNQVREGNVTNNEVKNFLQSRITNKVEKDFNGVILFSKREDVNIYNETKLNELDGPEMVYETEYWINPDYDNISPDTYKNFFSISETLKIRTGALVMMKINDTLDWSYSNGSMGVVTNFDEETIFVKLFSNDIELEVRKFSFCINNAEGETVVYAKNFPLILAWAMTIHKAQGMTTDKILVQLNDIFAAGQAYVALSRVTTREGLFISDYNLKKIYMHEDVKSFYNKLASERQSELIIIIKEIISSNEFLASRRAYQQIKASMIESKTVYIQRFDKIIGSCVITDFNYNYPEKCGLFKITVESFKPLDLPCPPTFNRYEQKCSELGWYTAVLSEQKPKRIIRKKIS